MYKIKLLEDCISEFAKLPGIGRKTAARLCMHILKMKIPDVERLVERIISFKKDIVTCPLCGGLSDELLERTCAVCRDIKRDKSTICVIEEAKDLFVIERIGYFRGVYHVLGGKISPLDGIGPDLLRIKELADRVREGGVKEIILATNPDVDGETTALYLTKILKDMGVTVSKLAAGLPLGTHLEYADEMTILRSLEGRRIQF